MTRISPFAVAAACLAASCAVNTQLLEIRVKKPTAASTRRYQVQGQYLSVDLRTSGSATSYVKLWLINREGQRVGEVHTHRIFDADGSATASVPLEGSPPNREPLPAGCYALRVAAYASDDVVSGGDSCTVAYAGPNSSTASVPCRLRHSTKDCR